MNTLEQTIGKLIENFKIIYDPSKYKILLQNRNIDLKKIVNFIRQRRYIKAIENKNYPYQINFIINYDFGQWPYTIVVPCKILPQKNEIVITTAYPSRKYLYLLKSINND